MDQNDTDRLVSDRGYPSATAAFDGVEDQRFIVYGQKNGFGHLSAKNSHSR